MSNTVEQLNILLENYFNVTIEFIEAAYIFDRNGLLLEKKVLSEENSKNEEEIYGAIAGVVEPTLKRITSEYPGSFGIGTFDIEEYRLIFIEAGPEAIFLSVFQYDVETNKVLPYCFLVAEKISKIVEGKMENISLTIPNLELGIELSISPKKIIEMKMDEEKLEKGTKKQKEMRFKLIVLGDPNVGKTSLINRFVTNQFHTDYKPTLGISITNQTYNIQGFEKNIINFMIWDLAGQKFFQRVRKAYYKGAIAAFIVFDVTNKESFHSIGGWISDVKKVLPDIPVVILGNKIDIESSRQISIEEATSYAKDLKCSFLETSAKSGENVRDAFNLIGIGIFFKLAHN